MGQGKLKKIKINFTSSSNNFSFWQGSVNLLWLTINNIHILDSQFNTLFKRRIKFYEFLDLNKMYILASDLFRKRK